MDGFEIGQHLPDWNTAAISRDGAGDERMHHRQVGGTYGSGLPKTEGVGCEMCLAIPLRLVEINNLAGVGKVETGDMSKDVSLMLLPKGVKIGDYVLVHAGFALQKLDEEAALETLNLLREMAEAIEQEENP